MEEIIFKETSDIYNLFYVFRNLNIIDAANVIVELEIGLE
jgi:hypothetical protein